MDGLWWEWITQGIFARLNYDYKGRYLFEISSRYDGSSRFMEGHRWSMLPSGSVGWRISEEPFFKPLRSWVDNLKIRASYGTLGNTLIKNANNNYYPYLRTLRRVLLQEAEQGKRSPALYEVHTNAIWERRSWR